MRASGALPPPRTAERDYPLAKGSNNTHPHTHTHTHTHPGSPLSTCIVLSCLVHRFQLGVSFCSRALRLAPHVAPGGALPLLLARCPWPLAQCAV
jgi:hypothetical protein